MSVRERTSIELPRALSGSNVLMAWPGVASTRTVATPGAVVADWADANAANAVNKNTIWADISAAFMASSGSDAGLQQYCMRPGIVAPSGGRQALDVSTNIDIVVS